jgi:hypothetical protein
MRIMTYINFSTRLPQAALDALDAEAAQQYRSRNQMLQTIIAERYKLTLSRPPARARPGRQKRKPKQKAEVN